MSFQTIVGFIMVLALVFCLIKKVLLPPIAFILFPVIAALICGFGMIEIGEFAGMVNTVSLFVFSISFFSLMSDAGIFDIVVNKLTKIAGTNVAAIMIATALIAVVGHLDGSGATTAPPACSCFFAGNIGETKSYSFGRRDTGGC